MSSRSLNTIVKSGRRILIITLLVLLPGQVLAVGQVGDLAADYYLQDTWGSWHDLASHQGNSVVLLNMIGST